MGCCGSPLSESCPSLHLSRCRLASSPSRDSCTIKLRAPRTHCSASRSLESNMDKSAPQMSQTRSFCWVEFASSWAVGLLVDICTGADWLRASAMLAWTKQYMSTARGRERHQRFNREHAITVRRAVRNRNESSAFPRYVLRHSMRQGPSLMLWGEAGCLDPTIHPTDQRGERPGAGANGTLIARHFRESTSSWSRASSWSGMSGHRTELGTSQDTPQRRRRAPSYPRPPALLFLQPVQRCHAPSAIECPWGLAEISISTETCPDR